MKASISWCVCMMQKMDTLFIETFFFARNWLQNSTKSLLPFHNTLLDFATLTNTSWATWEIPSNYVITNVA